VTRSPSPARWIACVAQTHRLRPRPRPPASPIVFGAHERQNTACVTTPRAAGTCIDRKPIDKVHACFVTVTSSTDGSGLLSQSKSQETYSRLAWPLAGGRARSIRASRSSTHVTPRAGRVRLPSRCLSRRYGCTARVRETRESRGGPASRRPLPVPGPFDCKATAHTETRVPLQRTSTSTL
jgi:hypothetical protein